MKFKHALGVALLSFAAAAASWAQTGIVVASTTSTEQSGLFGHLLPQFSKETGIGTKNPAACSFARFIHLLL